MKRHRLVAALIALPFMLCMSGATKAQLTGEGPYFYYGAEGAQVPLDLSVEKVGVVFVSGMDETGREEAVAQWPEFWPLSETEQVEGLLDLDMVVLELKTPTSEDGMRELMDFLAGDPVIARALPVFEVVMGYGNLLMERFSVGFDLSTPEEEIDALNGEHALEVVKRTERPNIGKVSYRLRLTAESQHDALWMANLYHEHPLSIEASPSFAPLFPIGGGGGGEGEGEGEGEGTTTDGPVGCSASALEHHPAGTVADEAILLAFVASVLCALGRRRRRPGVPVHGRPQASQWGGLPEREHGEPQTDLGSGMDCS